MKMDHEPIGFWRETVVEAAAARTAGGAAQPLRP
jgi:hypothetical protein